MSKEYLEAIERIKNKFINFFHEDNPDVECVEDALQRLETIDNANPSEAIKLFEEFKHILLDNVLFLDIDLQRLNGIKQVLLKAQEQENKKYLKWEDLEFSFKEKYMKVKLNGNIYTLRYTRNGVMEFPVAYLEFNNTEITIIDCKKQFFNDLHLEVLNNE